MAKLVEQIMAFHPVVLQRDDTVVTAAEKMRDNDVGDVIVTDGGEIVGILTDRDIVVRLIAEGGDPMSCPVGEIASLDLTVVAPDTDLDEALALMRQRAVRRLPVVEDGKPVGVVSLGDLALEHDPQSALAEVSSAPPNI